MKLSDFMNLLEAHSDQSIVLVLPHSEKTVPASFHVTEVGHVVKRFIDCGGTKRTSQSCQLQVWLGSDAHHRLSTGKLAGILDKARAGGVLPVDDLDVEFEYEDDVISQYVVEGHSVSEDEILLSLGAKHTDCLAKDRCLPSLPMASSAEACCAGGGCC